MSERRRIDRLVFFTTDAGYLVPTLVAALQVLRQAIAIADVAIFLVGIDDRVARALQDEFPGISFHVLEPERFALPQHATFNDTHVPPSALARLIVGERIAPHYRHLVYLDGDIQIVGDIVPLLKFDVPVGKLLAAPDVAEMIWPEYGVFADGFRRYARKLGIEKPSDYFNSGVLAVRRETWVTLGQSAFSFISAHSDLCRFHDQSALNKVAGPNRLRLSSRYNFIPTYQKLVRDPLTAAAILHFAGGEKPWQHPGSARSRFLYEYDELVAQHTVLRPFWEVTSGRVGHGPARVRDWRVVLALWRSLSRRARYRWRAAREQFVLG